jgi:hypothetical protein
MTSIPPPGPGRFPPHFEEIVQRLAKGAARQRAAPAAEPVGLLIMEEGAPAYRSIRTILQQATGVERVPHWIAAVVPWDLIVQVLKADGGATGDQFLREGAALVGRRFPLLVGSQHGFITGIVECDEDDQA